VQTALEEWMNIAQFRYGSDNLGYLLYGTRSALAIDGGAPAAIENFAQKHGLHLKWVTNTHGHADHTSGNPVLLESSDADYIEPMELSRRQRLDIDGETVRILHTPGHTTDSITLAADGMLITGDTLFNGTVGNCFSGDLEAFYHSIKTLMAFPENTFIYAGHDYVSYSMRFARIIEPDNSDIHGFLKRYDPDWVRSTLADEMRVNPYLRFNHPQMIAILEDRGFSVDTEYQRWTSMMELG
jgi:hydroxyacylglutathione hydrolase